MGVSPGSVTAAVTINENRLNFIFADGFYSAHGVDAEMHSHSFYEMHFFTLGSGSVEFKDETVQFGANMLLIAAPETYHIQRKSSTEVRKYVFKFSAAVSNERDDILVPLLGLIDSKGFLVLRGCEFLKDVLGRVQVELRGEEKGYLSLISNSLSSMMIELSRSSCTEGALLKPNHSRREHVSVITATIIDYFFDQNYNRNAKIDDLCSLVHLSQSQLSRTIKTMYGMTFKEKHTSTRINYVAHLLVKDELSITQIALMCGFDSVSTFSNYFKRRMHISPQQYRKQNRSL
ncbi:MAG: helix-turn-helix transcriptional regulator [Clostridia bacterium]|jgi:AraC-like DNA-binding protein/mannose-6-phosphate isomerase-like protein (cupin superfamily)|nr:helix-turn-helix transcriptional regulator [Clostridia bacterium]MBT7121929.1 helix-turn-helix transcriptional regulator [Clostridia bacterium]